MTEGLISINGTISSPEDAKIPALDRGLLFADNVFEAIVGFYDTLLDVQEHLDRLRRSAGDLFIDIPWSDDDLRFEMEAIAEQITAPKKYIRLVVTRGNGLGLKIPKDCAPNKFIYAFAARPEPQETFSNGLKLKLRKQPFTERGSNPKTGNYLRSILALRQAQAEAYDDVIWANSENEVTEATTANIFFLGRQGDLLEVATPPVNSGILQGITRSTMINLLNRSQIPVTERVIYHDEIPRFDEAFICSTIRGLLPVGSIDSHRMSTPRDKSIFWQLKRLHDAWTTSQLGYPVDWNTGAKLSV